MVGPTGGTNIGQQIPATIFFENHRIGRIDVIYYDFMQTPIMGKIMRLIKSDLFGARGFGYHEYIVTMVEDKWKRQMNVLVEHDLWLTDARFR